VPKTFIDSGRGGGEKKQGGGFRWKVIPDVKGKIRDQDLLSDFPSREKIKASRGGTKDIGTNPASYR